MTLTLELSTFSHSLADDNDMWPTVQARAATLAAERATREKNIEVTRTIRLSADATVRHQVCGEATLTFTGLDEHGEVVSGVYTTLYGMTADAVGQVIGKFVAGESVVIHGRFVTRRSDVITRPDDGSVVFLGLMVD